MVSDTPILQLKGIGEKTNALFQKLDLYTTKDLLYSFPKDYDLPAAPVEIGKLKIGAVSAVMGQVWGNVTMKKVRNLTILNVPIRDNSGAMSITFFNMPYLRNMMRKGAFFVFRGLVQQKGPSLYMEQPKTFTPAEYDSYCGKIQPKYSLTKGLTNNTFQKAVKQALLATDFGIEPYPDDLLRNCDLTDLKEAVTGIHFPDTFDQLTNARKRLVFDEFFEFIYYLKKSKDNTDHIPNPYPMMDTKESIGFSDKLPYALTRAQKRTWQEIRMDLASPYCMNRLVQGDVGSGKTIIAIMALLLCVTNGYQGAMMAPTEVLATQHYEEICHYAKELELPLMPVLLVGSMTAKEKRQAYESLKDGSANIAVGTHAVIQEKVEFQNLALVITDEQHRFGVKQREKLASKGKDPHVLVMSATPIPRTLAIILYGDLQLSVIDELPSNRLPIKNCVVGTSYRPKAYEFIAKQIAEGRQAYVICPMVEEGESDHLENVIDYTEKLRAALPPSVRLGTLHGKMKPDIKNKIMESFKNQEIDVLVSTTVIEVGINVPNATVMMIENAESFGLAGLHQLRGRVGRGQYQSYCIFINTGDGETTQKRLSILNETNDGFKIASEDLKLRGPGDIFKIRQSGKFSFQIGDVYTDAPVLKQAGEWVDRILSEPYNYTDLIHYMDSRSNKVDFRSI